MKIGVSSYSFLRHVKATGCDYITMCDLAKEMGYDGIEFIDLGRLIDCPDGEMAEAARIRERCAKIGLEVVAYTVHGNFLADDQQAELERLRGQVDVAEALGAKIMRHDGAWGPRPIHGYTYKDAIREIAPLIRELTEYAQTKGVKTCTENHGRFLQDPERVRELIEAVNHPNYGWLIDMGNFMGVDADIIEAVQIAAPYAFHVHAKDNLWKSGMGVAPVGYSRTRRGDYLRATVAGHGDVPIQQCVNIVREAGYDGYVSLEFEGWEDNLQALKAGHDFLRRIV